jgi:hypothetical protein
VKLARSWVSTVLRDIGRDDLVDAAQLGVSELVTNALIHSRPPLLVRILGTTDHPRIEVVDSSPVPPQRAPVAPAPEEVDDFNLTTYGRGLDLVAMMSARWGADLGHDGRSKTVWFEPTDGANPEGHGEAQIFTFDPDRVDPAEKVDGQRMTVQLCQVPAVLFGELRRYHFELRRELRLLAMTAPADYPLAVTLTEAFVRGDRERRATRGIERLDQAIRRREASVDLEYRVPLSAPANMAHIRDLLAQVYQQFSSEHLLAVRPPEVLLELQTWYFTEFERQAAGEQPRPWTGPLHLPHDDRRTG